MKANPKDYDIFNYVKIPHISEYLPNKTNEEASTMIRQYRYEGPYAIYNTTHKTAQFLTLNSQNEVIKIWQNSSDPLKVNIVTGSSYGYGSTWQQYIHAPNYIEVNKQEIRAAKEAFETGQKVKQGKFSYLWKENSVQTQIDTEEQSTQVLSEVREQSIQTEQAIANVSTQTKNIVIDVSTQTDTYVDPALKERDIKLTKFVSEFYNKFSDNEEIEAFYNRFLNIMDESQLSGEHNSNVDYFE